MSAKHKRRDARATGKPTPEKLLTAEQRASKSLYSYQRPATVQVIQQADGTRLHRLPPKPLIETRPLFDAFARLEQVLSDAQRKIAASAGTNSKPLAPLACSRFLALLTRYECLCGTHTNLLTGFMRETTGHNNTTTLQPINYSPEHYEKRVTVEQTYRCANCI